MNCKHEFRQIPEANYQWCTRCGTLQDAFHPQQVWIPEIYDLFKDILVPLSDKEKAFCEQDMKFYAINEIRKRTGLGLYEAKRIIDAYMKKNPPSPKVSLAVGTKLHPEMEWFWNGTGWENPQGNELYS